MTAMTSTTSPSSARDCLRLPTLSDEAAAQLYLFVEHLFLLIESRYGDQIRRHFRELEHPDFAGPEFNTPFDDPLF